MNMQQMMRQAQNMQRKMKENEEKLHKMEFIGSSASDSVSITLYGTGKMKSIKIDKSILDINDIETLEDMVVVAFNNAKDKLDIATSESMSDATDGIDLKNFKLPF